MSRDGDGSPNIFVRFKQHVDTNIASGFNTLLGHPTAPRRAGTPSSAAVATDDLSTSTPPQPHVMELQDSDRRPPSWDVLSLMSSASYSPSALRHLPQPIPNDLPPDLDAYVFTFEDAFEDLLAVSLGQPLPDIGTKYEQRKLLTQMFPNGEPTWFWMRRLQSQGLVESPNRGRFFRALRPDWDGFHRELDRRAAKVWRGASGDEEGDEDVGELFHEIGRAFKQIERDFSDEASLAVPQEEPEADSASQRRRQPDTFDDLFSSISSSFAKGQKSWDAFLKTISDQATALEKRKDANHHDGELKQVETRDEYVDRFGYLHSTVTRKTLDNDGNEIGRETYVTMRPADKSSEQQQQQQQLDNRTKDELDHSEAVGDESDKSKSGWFWK
ncbi:carboxypeptidase cpdS precursor [Purpureocillium lavendulum]|uniref:Carboxypeptidase cpdS n=1 Tax=Purpureocillium lavendulum TaxID=1247861 RepID=A0AB34FRZ9_9HYPO|nr:carboxypeptidase cpdS precursor [Purpureocillium lavendulum]